MKSKDLSVAENATFAAAWNVTYVATWKATGGESGDAGENSMLMDAILSATYMATTEFINEI